MYYTNVADLLYSITVFKVLLGVHIEFHSTANFENIVTAKCYGANYQFYNIHI